MPFEGTFRLTKEEQAMKSDAFLIHLRVKDTAGNSEVKTLAFNRDNEAPTAKLKVMAHSGSAAITEVAGTVTIAAELSGTGSPLKEAKLNLYRITKTTDEAGQEIEKEEYVNTLEEDITQATSLEWNTTALENGDYRLKAAVKDSSDLEGSGTYDIKIANPQGARSLLPNRFGKIRSRQLGNSMRAASRLKGWSTCFREIRSGPKCLIQRKNPASLQ